MREEIKGRIYKSVFYIYSHILPISFPFDVRKAVSLNKNCRIMTYDELEKASDSSHEDVIHACESYTGCTKYDPASGRFLILVNTSDRNTVSKERINWTIAHEFGHIVCGHFDELLVSTAGDLRSSEINNAEMEEEADFFAASLLSPIPALCQIGVRNVRDIRRCFGLSQQASERRWAELKRYCNGENGYSFLWDTQEFTRLLRSQGFSAPKPSGRHHETIIPKAKAIDIMPDEEF